MLVPLLLFNHFSQIGFNPSEDFTSHWWTKKFNETAKSINVEHKKVLECYLYEPDHFLCSLGSCVPIRNFVQPLERLAQPY